ncbi:flagellin [Domibacillus indicus]|uniref:flagellin n=1 Tax=Domibacillus indicus TaxID=1437523 RepID=UPI000AAE23F2|nr:flagellin [Domibacillus indicus]
MRLQSFSYSMARYDQNNLKAKKSMEKISTGSQISRASQNPANVAISETIRAQVRGLERGQRNLQDGLSLLSAADEGLNHVTKQLHRGYELAVMSANDTLTDGDRKSAQKELDEIMDSINDTAEYLEFNTINLFGNDKVLHLAGSASGKSLSIDLEKLNVDALGLTGASIETSDDARALFPKIQDAVLQTTHQLTKIGSYYETIEHEMERNSVLGENLTKGLSKIEDTQVGREVIELAIAGIRQQADHLFIHDTNELAKGVLAIFK